MSTPITLSTRPLVLPGEKAWPSNLASLYERLKQDVRLTLPDSHGSLAIGPQQPDDVQTIWFRLSGEGEFVGVYCYINGLWQNVTTPVGTIAFRSGRPDKFENGLDGWWVCDGENGTQDYREMFRTADGSPVIGRSANKTFYGFWAQLRSQLDIFKSVTTPTLTEVKNLLLSMQEYMKQADECDCNDGYDASQVTAFVVEFKGRPLT